MQSSRILLPRKWCPLLVRRQKPHDRFWPIATYALSDILGRYRSKADLVTGQMIRRCYPPTAQALDTLDQELDALGGKSCMRRQQRFALGIDVSRVHHQNRPPQRQLEPAGIGRVDDISGDPGRSPAVVADPEMRQQLGHRSRGFV